MERKGRTGAIFSLGPGRAPQGCLPRAPLWGERTGGKPSSPDVPRSAGTVAQRCGEPSLPLRNENPFPSFSAPLQGRFPLKKKKKFRVRVAFKKKRFFFFFLLFFSPFKTHRFESNASGNIEVPHTMIALRSPGLSARVSRTRSGCVQSPAEIR